MPRWGKVGKQKIEDAGPLPPHPVAGIKYNMETVDWDFINASTTFMDKAIADKKPFFCWVNPTRMHVVTHLSPKYEGMRNSKNGWTESEAGMAELDDEIGAIMKYLKDKGIDDNTIVIFTTDNGTEQFTWPDGGQTPFAGNKGQVLEGGFRAPCIITWPGHVPENTINNGIFSGLDWMPTLLAAAGNPDITNQLLKGATIGGTTYKNHIDGYNQLDAITGKGESIRHEIYYFGESSLGAVRIDDFKYRFIEQPQGWVGEKTHVDMPILTNLRLDPFERTGWASDGAAKGSMQYWDWFKYEFWRFVFVQQEVGKLAQSAIDYPPMQAGASFNLDALKEELKKKAAQANSAGN
jgi:arylsulfatase